MANVDFRCIKPMDGEIQQDETEKLRRGRQVCGRRKVRLVSCDGEETVSDKKECVEYHRESDRSRAKPVTSGSKDVTGDLGKSCFKGIVVVQAPVVADQVAQGNPARDRWRPNRDLDSAIFVGKVKRTQVALGLEGRQSVGAAAVPDPRSAIDVLSSIRAKPVTLDMDFLAEAWENLKRLFSPSWLLVWGGILGVLLLLVIGSCCVYRCWQQGRYRYERLVLAVEAASAGDEPRVAIYLAQACHA
ncbi:hypothetical protein H920_14425 [Fukomys damarensis]|uniref:Uncharacterized protein n=1 Tax=Fukomys damarensis TaxID=885580 RepID=A0A091D295_FUKDA|nr:hypothetical protein H920_14425 [Fukomys damarensis]